MIDCSRMFIKVYPIYQLDGIDFSKPLEEPPIVCWEINFDCDQKNVLLKRRSRFQSFEEATLICQLAGYECKKCKWLPYPANIDRYGRIEFERNGKYVPENEYESCKRKIYLEKLGKKYMNFKENLYEKNSYWLCKY